MELATGYIDAAGSGEYTEKKSRFIGEIRAVRTPDEATAFLRETRKLHNDARHHCMAYILGANSGTKHSSDDGEPSGTAGRPILSVLEGAKITDAALIVTRYFGGTLLGTGGLVRAYTAAAKAAVEDSRILRPVPGMTAEIEIDYAGWPAAESFFRKEGVSVIGTEYAETVRVTIAYPANGTGSAKHQQIAKALSAIRKTGDPFDKISPCLVAEADDMLVIYEGDSIRRYSL